jgi:predicted PurR-regulated permease PerM
MSTNWRTSTRTIAAISLAAASIFLIYVSRSIIPYLVIAALIAVIARPFILWLHQRARLPRGLAVGLVYLVGLMLVPLALLLTLPAIADSISFVLNLDYQSIFLNLLSWLRTNLAAIQAIVLPVPGLDQAVDQAIATLLKQLGQTTTSQTAPQLSSLETIIQSLGTALQTTFRTAAGVVSLLFSQLTLWLFIFLSSIYISLGAHSYKDGFLGILPASYQPEIKTLLDRIEHTWNAFFRGELILMTVIGLISGIGLAILGIPGALYLGIIAGLLEMLPNLGPIIATVPAVIVALLQGSTYLPVSPLVMALIVILFYIMVQQLENSLIVPRILGEAVDLPALVVMSGVLIGAEVGGLLGALLATPVVATIRELMRYTYRKILAQEPFPPGERLPDPPANPLPQISAWLKARFAPRTKPGQHTKK